MARSASDATRFTATTPNAASKPISTSNIKNLGSGAIPGETPQQKIARLRAAAAAARAGKESNFDKVVRSGRRWADRAHRVTAYSLIGLTVASGIIASFAIGDMLIHNRRKRAEWLLDQQTRHRAQIEEAKALLSSGQSITEDQMLLLNQERAAWESAEAQKNKKGIFSKAKDAVYSSVPDEEIKGGEISRQVREIVRDGQGGFKEVVREAKELAGQAQQKVEDLGVLKAVEHRVQQGKQGLEAGKQKVESGIETGKQRVESGLEQVEKKAGDLLERRPTSDLGVKVLGGPLDREAQAVSDAVKQTSKSWTDWVLRR